MEYAPTEKVKELGNKADRLVFSHWPAFAAFIRANHMDEYARELLRLSREADLPIMKLISHLPEEQLLQMTIHAHGEFLENVEKNILRQHLEDGLKKWENNDLEIISSDEIATEDITIGTFIRKKAMMKLLPLYTTDPYALLEIIKEIDTFDTEAVTVSTKLHFNILRNKIQENLHFIEKISNTTPGLSYVYDIKNNQLKYANRNYLNYFGETLERIQELGEVFSLERLHPDDQSRTLEVMSLVTQMSNTDMLTLENRMKNADGKYRWMRHYFSVFKRDEQNHPVEVVGIALDIEKEKRSSEKLAYREDQLLEAQAIGEIGSFEWIFGNTDKTTVTPQLLKIFGLESIIEFESFMDYIHPVDRPKVQKAIDDAIKNNGIYECEYRYIRNGVEKIIWSRGVVTQSAGSPYSMKGTIMDVSERNHMLHRLQRSEELYKQAQSLSHMGNYSYDLTLNRMQWTDEVYRIFCMEPQSQEINFDTYTSFIHPEDRDRVIGMVNKVMEDKSQQEYRYTIICKTGKTKILHTITEPILDENKKALKIVGTIHDVTEKVLIEEQIKAKEAFITKIADTAPSIIATYNINNGKYNFVSEGITKLLGYEPAEVMEKGVAFFTDRLHPDDLAAITEKNNNAIQFANEEENRDIPMVEEFKYRVMDATGKYRWLHTYGTIFDRNSEGKVEHVLNVSVDITDQVEAEHELQQKNLELQISNSSLRDYAYIASHDLKEPLRKISTFSSILMNTHKDNMPTEAQAYLTKISNAALRMQNMINDLLMISTISGNKAFETYSLRDVVAEALQPIEHIIEDKKAIITVGTLPEARIVPAQFRQLFQNLVNNSLKFSREGVPPEITISSQYLKPSDVRGHNILKANSYLQIDFTDNGIGFDNVYAEKIFSIFQRLHGQSEYEGTGIGLSICKKVIENHGGVIFASGQPGEGAKFTIILPV